MERIHDALLRVENSFIEFFGVEMGWGFQFYVGSFQRYRNRQSGACILLNPLTVTSASSVGH